MCIGLQGSRWREPHELIQEVFAITVLEGLSTLIELKNFGERLVHGYITEGHDKIVDKWIEVGCRLGHDSSEIIKVAFEIENKKVPDAINSVN